MGFIANVIDPVAVGLSRKRKLLYPLVFASIAVAFAGTLAAAIPQALPASPSVATVSPETFRISARDADGFGNINRIYFLVNVTPTIPVNTCHGFYDRPSGGLFLYDDALTTLNGPLAPDTGGVLQNSQCKVIGNGATVVSAAGTDLVIDLKLALIGGYSAGTKNLYTWVVDAESNGTGWVLNAAWTPGSSLAPSVVSGTPTNPTGSPQTFTFTVADPDGSSDIFRIYFLFNPNPAIPQNTCHGFYDRASNQFYLYDDTLTTAQGPLAPGVASTIHNGQCTIYGTGSSLVSTANNTLVINMRASLTGLFANSPQNIYLWVVDASASGTGWIKTGTWQPTIPANYPKVVSSNPSMVTDSPKTFRLTSRDADGSQNINRIYFLVNSTPSIPTNTCHGFYDRSANSLFLYDDTLSTLMGPLSLGSSGSLQNTQCRIDGLGSAVIGSSGTDLVLDLKMSLKGTYRSSPKNSYIWVVDAQSNGTGWVQVGTWADLSDFRNCISYGGSTAPECNLDPGPGPGGRYVISETLEVSRSNIVISGDWRGVTLQRAPGFQGPLMRVGNGLSQVWVQGITFDGFRFNGGNSVNEAELDVGSCTDCRVTYNSFVDSPHISLAIAPTATRALVKWNKFQKAYHMGIYSGTGNCAALPLERCLSIYSNTFEYVGTNAIFLTSSRANIGYNTLTGNHAECSYGAPGGQIDLDEGASQIDVFWNSIMLGPTCSGGSPYWAQGIEIHGSDITVVDNIITDNAGEGIYLEEAQNISISATDSTRKIQGNNKKGSGFPGCGGFPGIRIHSKVGGRPTQNLTVQGVAPSRLNIVDGHSWGVDVSSCRDLNAPPSFNGSNITVTKGCFSGNTNFGADGVGRNFSGSIPGLIVSDNISTIGCPSN